MLHESCGGPLPPATPDTSTSYRVDVCAVFPGPGTTQPWLFPGGQSRLSPAPWRPRGDGGLGWDGVRVPCPASPSAFLFPNTVGSKETSSGWAWGRGRHQRAPGAPSALPRHPSFSGRALPEGHSPRGFQSLPCTLMPVPPSHGPLRARGLGPCRGGRRPLDSCHCLPLCPPWGTGRVGEEREDREDPALKRLPGGPSISAP